VSLNGWQRIFVVVSVLWVLAVVWQFSAALAPSGNPPVRVAGLLAFCLVPPATVYGLGLVAAWVGRGFREEAHR
jgi:hypothetical protein